ncbi:hypothetical protein RIF29_21616 [Crotalaria pallida]|uniref:Uncharacterized protein n=1 Tax=Crotalaria pallida TaxID=3830 RepID=A0AAN9F304_CROPI
MLTITQLLSSIYVRFKILNMRAANRGLNFRTHGLALNFRIVDNKVIQPSMVPKELAKVNLVDPGLDDLREFFLSKYYDSKLLALAIFAKAG